MGVLGLWQLIQSTGRPVTLESLENKTLAVDVSMWLHQAVRGVRDRRGIATSDAHLLVLFNRICKLLHYRIKPVFVFDGPAPVVKQRQLERRRNARANAQARAEKLSRKWLENVVQQQAVNEALRSNGKSPVKGRNPTPPKPTGKSPRRGKRKADDTEKLNVLEMETNPSSDMYALPPIVAEEPSSSAIFDTSTEEESSDDEDGIPSSTGVNLERFNINSDDFKALPADIRYEILIDLQASRRRPSWKNANQLPAESDKFSKFQINRLLNRCQVQVELDKTSRELNSHRTGQICEKLGEELADGAVFTVDAKRIASEDSAHYLLVKRQNSGSIQRSLSLEKRTMMDDITIIAEKKGAAKPEDISILLPESVRKVLESSITVKPAPALPDLILIDDDEHEEPLRLTENVVRVHKFANQKTFTQPSKPVSPKKIIARKAPVDVIDIEAEMEKDVVLAKQSGKKLADSIPSPSLPSEKVQGYKEVVGVSLDVEETERPVSKNLDDSIMISDVSDSEGDFVDVTPVKEKNAAHSSGDKNVDMEDLVDYYTNADFSDIMDAFARTPSPQPSTSRGPSHSSGKEISSAHSTLSLRQSTIQDLDDDALHAFLSVPDFDLREPSKNVDVVEVIDVEDEDQTTELSVDELRNLQDHLASEGMQLRIEQKKEERVAASVTEQLRLECQELLRLFGIPFIVSPGEAEAQCAYLDITKQTHGTITDDSDVFLFGGQKVYRNMFHMTKYVEYYNAADIEKQLGLERDKLIALALLVGSDYTEGIEGVGAVRALEILADFGGNGVDSLKNFSTWFNASTARRKNGDRRPESRLRSQLINLSVPQNFPDQLVVDAYHQPVLDESKEKFTWGVPTLDLLREYTRKKFGWNKLKTDETVLPLIKRLNTRTTQTHLESFFKVVLRKPMNITVSKRVGNALKKMKSSEDLSVETVKKPTEKKGGSEYFPKKNEQKRGKAKSVEKESDNGSVGKKRGRPTKKNGTSQVGSNGKRKGSDETDADYDQPSTSQGSTGKKAASGVKRQKKNGASRTNSA